MAGAVAGEQVALLVTDIDNTVFDWVAYYAKACQALLNSVGRTIGVDYSVLAEEARAVFQSMASIEYPFVVQEMPSVIKHYGDKIDTMLSECVEPAREAFKEAAKPYLKPYDGVIDALTEIRRRRPDLPLVALTDAPRYVAMWKLNKLGLLDFFSAVYGLADPRLPTDSSVGRVKVDPAILLKHLQQKNFDYKGRIRILPEDYEKPGVKGLKTVLMDYELDEPLTKRRSVMWVGDNLRKDIGLGNRLQVTSVWAQYGAEIDAGMRSILNTFSPPLNIHKNMNIDPADPSAAKPDIVLTRFADLMAHLW